MCAFGLNLCTFGDCAESGCRWSWWADSSWKNRPVPIEPQSHPPNGVRAAGSVRPKSPARPEGDGAAPYWWEDPELAAAVAEVEEFVSAAGWDAPPQMFALVRTADLLAAQPDLAGALSDAGTFTPIAQEVLPTGDLSEALSQISWPPEVGGCVLVQEIVVLPPSAVEPEPVSSGPDAALRPPGGARNQPPVEITAEQAAAHPDRTEARLVAGVLRGSRGGACMLRIRGREDTEPLRGADLAPNLLTVLQATFDD